MYNIKLSHHAWPKNVMSKLNLTSKITVAVSLSLFLTTMGNAAGISKKQNELLSFEILVGLWWSI